MSASPPARARGFGFWYAAVLTCTFATVEGARAWQGAPPTPPPAEPTEVIVAVPPKPQTETRKGDGAGPARATYTWEQCESMPKGYRDSCYSQLARQRAERDPDGALQACAVVIEDKLRYMCVADVAELHALIDVERSKQICATIEHGKWADQCTFGIAMAYVHTDRDFARQTCREAGRWEVFCLHDVNGEISQIDPDDAMAFCRELEPARHKHCWHGVGKYIARVDVPSGIEACWQAPTERDLQGQCFHGVGWAAAESAGRDAAAVCEGLEGMRDSCLMGVAYHAKRYAVDDARELCARVSYAPDRDRCFTMVDRAVKGPGVPIEN